MRSVSFPNFCQDWRAVCRADSLLIQLRAAGFITVSHRLLLGVNLQRDQLEVRLIVGATYPMRHFEIAKVLEGVQ